jgi:hypothetical protein
MAMSERKVDSMHCIWKPRWLRNQCRSAEDGSHHDNARARGDVFQRPDGKSCQTVTVKYIFKEVQLTNHAAGQFLQVPLLDAETDALIGGYVDATTYFPNAIMDDCGYFGSYNFELLSDGYFADQILIQGICSGVVDGVVGGIGKYTGVRGYAAFNDTVSEDYGYVHIHTCHGWCHSCFDYHP